jgi:glycine betaine/proline transport system ATP-binding protein
MSSSHPKIRIENLVKIYGENPKRALKMFREGGNRDEILKATGNVLGVADVSLDINEGELFVIMGLSGSGKSTLVRCINRLIESTSGHIYLDGEDILKVNKERLRDIRRTKISMVFQRFGLFPHKTVIENVEYGLQLRGVSTQERRDKAQETLEAVGLGAWGEYFPDNLSGGMQQRVGLARALATDAPIMLMDEAFSALDPLIRRGMQDELIRLQEELHKTIIFISHDIQESLKIGDRVAIMKDGYLVQVGTPQEIVTNPVDDYIRAFTLDVNRAQVLKTGSILRTTRPFNLGTGPAANALRQMKEFQRQHMYVINDSGQPVGLLIRDELEAAVHQGVTEVQKVMVTDFPTVDINNTLEDIFHVAQENIPLAVLSDYGKFRGVVEPSDIFSSISTPATNGNGAEPAPAAAPTAVTA